MNMFDAYWIVLGQFMVEGEGTQMLQEIFLSPGDGSGARSFSEWRDRDRDSGGAHFDPDLEVADGPNSDTLRVGSYRYTPSALVSHTGLQFDDRGQITDADENITTNLQGQIKPGKVIYNNAASISFPGKKVLFWSWQAFNDSGQRLAWAGGGVPVVTQDGSARVVFPGGSDTVNTRDGLQGAGPALTNLSVYYLPGDRDVPGLRGYFYLTVNGIRGRDLL